VEKPVFHCPFVLILLMQMESVGSREIRTGGWQEMKMITFVDLSLVVVHNLNEKLTKPVNLSDDFFAIL
jgi:hypothetical protein